MNTYKKAKDVPEHCPKCKAGRYKKQAGAEHTFVEMLAARVRGWQIVQVPHPQWLARLTRGHVYLWSHFEAYCGDCMLEAAIANPDPLLKRVMELQDKFEGGMMPMPFGSGSLPKGVH